MVQVNSRSNSTNFPFKLILSHLPTLQLGYHKLLDIACVKTPSHALFLRTVKKTIVTYLLNLLFMLFIYGTTQAEVIRESGSLIEFIGGNSPTTAYDNYISHVSEGIASPGYNDYGPDWVDVQSNGFGDYRIISDFDYTLVHWRQIFQALLAGDIEAADQMLTDSLETFHYELVRFEDVDYQRTFYLIREQLDSSYVDENQPDVEEDDVIGSFANGWGLFIINPAATRQHVVVEIPHPCDDFIAPYVGTEMFLQTDAFAMMIAGAGREVKWTENPPYYNNKSLSDPARNDNTVFQVFHEVLSDSLMQIGPHSPLVLHTHSFDDNSAHSNFQSIVLSAGWDAANANKPIRDISEDNLDFVNFTAEYPIFADQFGAHPALRVDDYYRVHYSGDLTYHGEDHDYDMPHTSTLLGPNTGVQMNYLRQFFNNNEVYEPWIQVEFFEKPMLFQEMEMPLTELYAGAYPSSYANHSILLDYYQPFVDAIQAYLNNWDDVADVSAPPGVTNWRTEFDGQSYVSLKWNPVFDTNHRSYEIMYDADSLTDESPVLDASDRVQLINPATNNIIMNDLDPDIDYVFKIRAVDHFENSGVWSEVINDNIPGHDPISVLEDFNSGDVRLESFYDEDDDPEDWELTDSRTFMNSDFALEIWGDTWKSQIIEPHRVSSESVFQVAAYIEHLGEIQGLGFQDSLNTLFYALDGTEPLNNDQWVTVNQGYFPQDQWNLFRMPVGDDWFARFDYFPRLTNIIYINDRDSDPAARVFFDELFDITNAIAFAPQVEISHSQGMIYRNSSNQRSVDVDFQAIIDDADSDNHSFIWNFGDGETSVSEFPSHTFLLEDDHAYTVLLQVLDESGNLGQARTEISVDQGESSFPLTLNFVGDIMIARRYEDDGGIVETGGVAAIFEPTIEILGHNADLTIANLECVMTIDGVEHPTKSVTYKGHPDYIPGLAEAGIDLVTLANNHTLDYGLVGLQNTQQGLNDANILHSGSGADSEEAYQPIFTNTKGVSIAWLANSDRTGQYNNAQPYLHAGYDKPGFAYLTPYYLLQQIDAVRDVADLIVMEMHAGSEYSTSPGSDYDRLIPGSLLDDWIAPPELTEHMDQPNETDEDESYTPLVDVPHMWDRDIRHFAIDSGSDLVVVHHPHIIQGFEAYNGGLIAHSLGNFVFDLNYHETFPSVILNAEIDASGFSAYSVNPVYLDDYIPVPATGALGLHLLDYLARKSRDLDTYLYVDRDNVIASVWLDTLSMPRTQILNRHGLELQLQGSNWVSNPVEIHKIGNLSSLSLSARDNWEYRLGRELLWYGNMEEEGSTQWNLNSSDEWLDVTEAHTGARSIGQHRSSSAGDNIITNLENRIRLDATKTHHVSGWIKTQNGSTVKVEVRYYSGRTTSFSLATHALNNGVVGTRDWTYFHQELNPPSTATYFDIRLNSDAPGFGDGYAWFDDIHITEWSDWESAPATDIISPNEFYAVQVRNPELIETANLQFTETVYTDMVLSSVDMLVDESIALVDTPIRFQDASVGPVGWWEWDFGDSTQSIQQHPVHEYSEPGIYDVSLAVMNPQGAPETVTREGYIRILSQYFPGDLNFDEQITISDIIVLVNIIIGDIAPNTLQLETADVNGDSSINIQDVITLINIILYD